MLYEENDISYELFTMKDLMQTAKVTARVFTHHEPMASTLKISMKDFTRFIGILGEKMEREELSIVARDNKTKKIVGAMISDDFAIDPPEDINLLGKKFEPIFEILGNLDDQYKRGKIISAGAYLHFFLIAVEKKFEGKHIAVNLVQTCINNGVRKGYKTGVVEATGVVSQHVFKKFGFSPKLEASYKTFKHKGRFIFKSIVGHDGIMLMDKELILDK